MPAGSHIHIVPGLPSGVPGALLQSFDLSRSSDNEVNGWSEGIVCPDAVACSDMATSCMVTLRTHDGEFLQPDSRRSGRQSGGAHIVKGVRWVPAAGVHHLQRHLPCTNTRRSRRRTWQQAAAVFGQGHPAAS